MSKGSFYHWFGDKLTLYTWVVACIAEEKNHGSKHIDVDENSIFSNTYEYS
jgi:AcrR family transcriptional regulator